MRILIANRGEIARRIIRTAHRLGHETVAAYADPDRNAPFVHEATMSFRLGPADLSASYLSVERMLAAILATGADAVHPGYGFLAENGTFARAVIGAGCAWIGPNPDAVDSMGSKIEARRLAAAANVPIIPGYDASQELADLAAAADRIGYPVLVKAAAGGGGKGIRIVHEAAGFDAALHEASSEAERSFGDGAMIVERYIQRPRHVEVQIVGDRHGSVLHFGTRECSVQRRYQKVLEEAPAPNLPDATRAGLHASAVQLAKAIGYDSAGTVEFIVDDESGDYFFLEMNTRLQVEHPVTESVTGIDLVELMIRSAAGEPLTISQDMITFSGHAFEARINAEDPANGFAPQIGTVSHLTVPEWVRWDSAIVEGDEITSFYDPMIAKLVVDGVDRPTARRRLARALDQLVVGGLVTNTGFHRWLIEQPPIVAGRVTTRFLDETELPAAPPPAIDETRPSARRLAGTRNVPDHATPQLPNRGSPIARRRVARVRRARRRQCATSRQRLDRPALAGRQRRRTHTFVHRTDPQRAVGSGRLRGPRARQCHRRTVPRGCHRGAGHTRPTRSRRRPGRRDRGDEDAPHLACRGPWHRRRGPSLSGRPGRQQSGARHLRSNPA
jgi:acetyl/propionyl-CoA carboxylase alpha subunit